MWHMLLPDPTIHQELLHNADTNVADRSTHQCQRCACTHHLCQPDNFVNAYGLMFCCQGLASITGPSLLGKFDLY